MSEAKPDPAAVLKRLRATSDEVERLLRIEEDGRRRGHAPELEDRLAIHRAEEDFDDALNAAISWAGPAAEAPR